MADWLDGRLFILEMHKIPTSQSRISPGHRLPPRHALFAPPLYLLALPLALALALALTAAPALVASVESLVEELKLALAFGDWP